MAKSINLTSSIRKIADAINLNNIMYFVYRATANKVCLAIQPDESHVHPYGRKWLTWDYVLRTSTLSDNQKTRINNLLKDFIGQAKVSEPTKKSPKSPKTEDCYTSTDKTSVKTNTSKKNVEDCYKKSAKKQEKSNVCEPTGAWQCNGTVAISPKGRSWKVINATKNGWVIESKSGITGFISHDGKYKSL